LRGKVIAMLIADPELSADDARVRAGIDAADGRAPSQEEKALSAVVGNLGGSQPRSRSRTCRCW